MEYQNKALLSYLGRSFVETLVEEFKEETAEILLSERAVRPAPSPVPAKEGTICPPAILKTLHLPTSCRIVHDHYENCGPLGGIEAALSACQGDALFVCACDTPRMKKELLQLLKSELTLHPECQAIVPQAQGRIQPLAAIYRREVLPVIRQQLEEGDYRMKNLLNRLKVRYLNLDSQPIIPHPEPAPIPSIIRHLEPAPIPSIIPHSEPAPSQPVINRDMFENVNTRADYKRLLEADQIQKAEQIQEGSGKTRWRE